MIALLRFWKEGVAAALLIAIGVLWLAKAGAERQNLKLKDQLREANLIIENERQAVRDRTALARAEDAANAARVERDQGTITQETVSAYQKDIAALRARAAGRVRAGTAAADRSGGGSAPVPGIPAAAGGIDGTAGEDGLPAADALIASEQALRLKALQDWVRGQAGVERLAGVEK